MLRERLSITRVDPVLTEQRLLRVNHMIEVGANALIRARHIIEALQSGNGDITSNINEVVAARERMVWLSTGLKSIQATMIAS